MFFESHRHVFVSRYLKHRRIGQADYHETPLSTTLILFCILRRTSQSLPFSEGDGMYGSDLLFVQMPSGVKHRPMRIWSHVNNDKLLCLRRLSGKHLLPNRIRRSWQNPVPVGMEYPSQSARSGPYPCHDTVHSIVLIHTKE